MAHFEDLTKSHDAVRRARDQLEALRPLVSTSDRYDDALARRAAAERQRQAVRLFVAELRIRLLDADIESNTQTRAGTAREVEDADRDRRAISAGRDALIEQRAGAGGDRLSELERLAGSALVEAEDRRGRRARFDSRLQEAALPSVSEATGFAELRAGLPVAHATATAHHHQLDEEFTTLSGRVGEVRRSGDETRTELLSLRGRTSNLPSSQLDVREQLCRDLDIDERELPFAGELIDVADRFAEWRGAAERVLRGFALSLLVPQRYYDLVARWVDGRRLTHRRADGKVAGSRLVYERVPAKQIRLQVATTSGVLLADTLDLADGPFRDYLGNEMIRRADFRCVDTIEEFREARRAVTRHGQMRSGDRHEKDDRQRIDDPRAWVLGWVNERKVAALTEQLVEQQRLLLELDQKLAQIARRPYDGSATIDRAFPARGLRIVDRA